MGRSGDQRGTRARRAIALAVALIGSATALAPAAVAISSDAYESRLFSLLNAERVRHGLRRVAPTRCGAGFATSWAVHLARMRALRHESVRNVVGTCRAVRGAENIAMGNVTPEEMMQMWMHSSGHRHNILDPYLTHVGLGAERGADGAWYGVQVFLGFDR